MFCYRNSKLYFISQSKWNNAKYGYYFPWLCNFWTYLVSISYRKHFRDLMSRTCEKDAVALARRVLLSSPETQEAVLHSFYCSTDPALEEVYQQLRQEEDKQKETNITKTKSQVARPKKPSEYNNTGII